VSAPHPGLPVASDTGVDLSLPVAGPGARAYAFLIDWHIRLVLALAWYVAAALLYNGALVLSPPASLDLRWFVGVLAPALALYFLYHYVIELALHGSTPGKRMAGVRITAQDGSVPGAGALLLRNVFRLLDSLPLCYAVGLVATVMTRAHQRIGDLAAGTLLVYEHGHARSAALESATGRRIDPVGAELIAELLERWQTIEPAARMRLAQQLIARYGGTGAASGTDERALHLELQRLLQPAAGELS
jgi:uncharacterized RDD family membrane protein YckC